MRRWLVAGLLIACAAAAAPSADVNLASLAEIERIKGVGTSLAANILEARAQGAFKDWGDLIRRVKGIGPGNAEKLSAQGLRVNDKPFSNQQTPSLPAAPASRPQLN